MSEAHVEEIWKTMYKLKNWESWKIGERIIIEHILKGLPKQQGIVDWEHKWRRIEMQVNQRCKWRRTSQSREHCRHWIWKLFLSIMVTKSESI